MFKKTKEKFHKNTKDSFENIGELKEKVKYRYSNFLQGRKENPSMYDDNFALVLEKWGIENNELEQVKHDLKMRCLVLCLPLFISIVLLIQQSYFTGLLVLVSALIAILTALWRFNVLKTKTFKPFHHYLFGFIFKKLRKG